jgi:hypothetical protein
MHAYVVLSTWQLVLDTPHTQTTMMFRGVPLLLLLSLLPAVITATCTRGPPPTITRSNSSCLTVSGVGSETVCAPTGATGATGATGLPGVTPRTTVVDGTTYALTVTGVNAAITARWFAGGGVISLTGDITVSDAPIMIRSLTTLDCNGYTIKAHPTDTIYNMGMVRTLGVGTGGPYNILANATRGMKNISFSPTDILNFLPGDHMNIRKCRMPDYPQYEADYHTFFVFAVDYAAGIVTLRNPLPFDCLVAGTAYVPTASRFVPITDAGIRNCVFSANGNNGTGFHLLTARNALRYKANNLRFTGYLPPDGMAFYSLDSVDCMYTNFETVNLQVQGGVRDIGFEACESCLVENIRSNGAGGFGPHIFRWHDGVVQNVWALQHGVRNFRVDSSYRCILRNIFTLNGWAEGSGTGLFVSFGSSYNVIDGLVSAGNVGRGLSFAWEGDAKNQITNYVAYANAGGDISAGVDTANNYVHGNYGLDAISGSDISYRNHLERVCGLNGLVAAEVKGPPFAKSTDLRPYEVTTTRANDTHLIESYRGADGFVRVFVKRFI